MNTDPIADFLTRVRNGLMAGHRMVEIPASKMKKAITEIMYENGYILKYKFADDEGPQGTIKIALKYDPLTRQPLMREIKRVSRPSRRVYVGHSDLPRVYNGLGVAVVSTSQGVLTNKQCRDRGIGGEVICEIF